MVAQQALGYGYLGSWPHSSLWRLALAARVASVKKTLKSENGLGREMKHGMASALAGMVVTVGIMKIGVSRAQYKCAVSMSRLIAGGWHVARHICALRVARRHPGIFAVKR